MAITTGLAAVLPAEWATARAIGMTPESFAAALTEALRRVTADVPDLVASAVEQDPPPA